MSEERDKEAEELEAAQKKRLKEVWGIGEAMTEPWELNREELEAAARQTWPQASQRATSEELRNVQQAAQRKLVAYLATNRCCSCSSYGRELQGFPAALWKELCEKLEVEP